MRWDKDAEKELKKVPFFVRGLARKKVEEHARSLGLEEVSMELFMEAENSFKAVMAGKSSDELMAMMPQPNKPGTSMLIIETCQHEISRCPYVLTNTWEIRETIERWAQHDDINERLRRRVESDIILYHNKFRVSISACPDGCSRPQIADIGIIAFVQPRLNMDTCTGCGICVDACPDNAIHVENNIACFDRQRCQGCISCRDACPVGSISLSDVGLRVLAGGKLGRHPRFADTVGEFKDIKDAMEFISKAVNAYIEESSTSERFADFWVRSRAGLNLAQQQEA